MFARAGYLIDLGKGYMVQLDQIRAIIPVEGVTFPDDFAGEKPAGVIVIRSGEQLPCHNPLEDLYEKIDDDRWGMPFVRLGGMWGVAPDNIAGLMPAPEESDYPEAKGLVICADEERLIPFFVDPAEIQYLFQPRSQGFFGE